MSHERNWEIRVNDILACIAKIERYTKELTFDQFVNEEQTIDADLPSLAEGLRELVK
jgi:uncharacterized protein with HEPN domain